MKISTLQDFYIEELRDMNDATNQVIQILPQMASEASNEELKSALEEQLEQSKDQLERLRKIFDDNGVTAKGKKCLGMAGIISECKELIDEDIEPEVLDAGLIVCVQKIQHYQIATYGSLCNFARLLGNEDDADQLQQSLDEQKESDEALTDLAESAINAEAVESEEEEEEEPKPRDKK